MTSLFYQETDLDYQYRKYKNSTKKTFKALKKIERSYWSESHNCAAKSQNLKVVENMQNRHMKERQAKQTLKNVGFARKSSIQFIKENGMEGNVRWEFGTTEFRSTAVFPFRA